MTASATTAAIDHAAPWYRSAWPWMLMAGPAFVIVGGAYATWLAASTSDGLVADDYYKRGMAINRTLARNEYSTKAGLSARIRIDAAGDVRLTLAREDGAATPPSQVRLRVLHPTRSGQDRGTTLGPDAAGGFVGHVDPPGMGRRLVVVETETWRLAGEVALGRANDIELAAPRAR
jgi:hypothetical protein